jgi:hypothetical protein
MKVEEICYRGQNALSLFCITNHIPKLTYLDPEEEDTVFVKHWYPLTKLHCAVIQQTIIFQIYRSTILKKRRN